MDEIKRDFVDYTILCTPKPSATSTAGKTTRKQDRNMDPAELENSLGILSLNEGDLSSVQENETVKLAKSSCQLQQQRLLANSSLQRANKVSGIPSKYLRPNMKNTSSISTLSLSTGSTINESDLSHKSPKNTSTPKTSIVPNDRYDSNSTRLSLGQSMAQLSYQIGNTDISIDNFVKEFHKAMKSMDNSVSPHVDSNIFTPAEDAASMLLADELSWRRQNDIPATSNFSQVVPEDLSCGKVSVGTFFQQRSDTLSDFQAAVSPVKKKKPVPLIDSVNSYTEEDNVKEEPNGAKSLSISAIRKFLAQTDDTPRKVTDYLLNQGKKSDDTVNDQSLLPGSKNSSYTTDFSENDAMNCIVQGIVTDKENIDTNNIQPREQCGMEPKKSSELANDPSPTPFSRSSSRASSALTSLPNGKLPIESTRSELIWGCVKVDKCVTQDFFLRNKSSKKLCIQMSLSGHQFKIRKENRLTSDPLSAAKIVLLPHESRMVIVSFLPTKIGAAIDELVFTSLEPNLQQTKKQCLRLYGYGGYGKVELHNLTKDTTGKFWMCLGTLDNQNMLKQSFSVKNTGTLSTFAHISFCAKEQFTPANIKIVPSFFVLNPNQQIEVEISYVPSLEDYRVFQHTMFNKSTVSDLGSMSIISSTEVNRGRVRRLFRKCTEANLTVDELSNILKEKIEGELMPLDLNQFKESPNCLHEMLKLLDRNEIIVTLEQDPEQTLMPQYPDDSAMFQSLCQDTSTHNADSSAITSVYCKLEPASIILTPPSKKNDILFLISEGQRTYRFEVVSHPVGLEISPKEGVISSGQEVILNLSCPTSSRCETRRFKVLVYIEHEVLEANVKIIYIRNQMKEKKK